MTHSETDTLTIDEICANLQDAFATEKDDPVSLVTYIDMYGEDVNQNYTVQDKAKFCETLQKLLVENPDVVRIIGWDLPKTLLSFLSPQNVPHFFALRSSKICIAVLKCFNEIAMNGDSKQCILTSIEILSDFSVKQVREECGNEPDESLWIEVKRVIDQENPAGFEHLQFKSIDDIKKSALDRDPVEFILGLKIYAIFELLGTSLKMVNTLHPSKYLSLTITALLKFFKSNIKDFTDVNFMLRRVFTFCRNYYPAGPPTILTDEEKRLSEEQLAEMISRDQAIQGKLLKTFVVSALAMLISPSNIFADIEYFCKLTNKQTTFNEYYIELSELKSRYYNLILSYDVDLKLEFNRLVEESRKLYSRLPMENTFKDKQKLAIFQNNVMKLACNYRLKKLSYQKQLDLDSTGVFILSGVYYTETHKHIISNMNIKDAMFLFMMYVTPSLFCEVFKNKATETTAQYWLLVALTNAPTNVIKKDAKEIPSYISISVLNLLLSFSYTATNEKFRMIYFTIITRLLCLLPEQISFQFINETLSNSDITTIPKSVVITMLRDLMTRTHNNMMEYTNNNKKQSDVDKLTKELSDVNISNDNNVPTPYIILNDERKSSLITIILNTIKDIPKRKNEDGYYLLILNYLSFLDGTKDKWDESDLKNINKTLTGTLKENEILDAKLSDKINKLNESLCNV